MKVNNDAKLRALSDGKETFGPAKISYVSTAGATKRAAKAFAFAFIGGILVLPVPLVHIFGAILLVGAPISAVLIFFKTRGMVEGMSGDFACPYCGAENHMEYQEGKSPFYGSCVSCKNPYQVFPA